MGIKRPLMILGSTVGAVAAVLSYHPAASGTAAPLPSAPEAPVDAPVTTSDVTPTPTPTETPIASSTPTPSGSAAATKSATKPAAKPAQKKSATKKSSGAGTSANATTDTAPSAPSPATPTPDATPAPKVAKDQTVTGATAQTRWGPVQVQITVKDGKIVDAVGLQYPNGDRRSQWISDQAIPWLVEETLSEQSANVQIIGGATYTSNGWRQSLASAMQKAGL